MKLIRCGPPGAESPGILLPDGRRLDASGAFREFDGGFFEGGGPERLAAWAQKEGGRAPSFPEDMRLGPPVARPGKIVCIGLNYRDHARETGAAIPREPVLFLKAPSALCGPDDDLLIPPGSTKTDWEVELGVVIGRTARRVGEEEALRHVAGYALFNDASEREYQWEHEGQWTKGKSCDTFAPLGPFLAAPDEVPNPQDLDLWLTVNGKPMQKGNTSNMIFAVSFLVSYVSRFMTLDPGDMISTGTPPGVGQGMKPPLYLKPGDVVECGIDGLGRSKRRAVQGV